MSLVDEIPELRGVGARGNRWAVSGEYCCAVCGYRILSSGELPDCAICHRQTWRLVAWRPFTSPELP